MGIFSCAGLSLSLGWENSFEEVSDSKYHGLTADLQLGEACPAFAASDTKTLFEQVDWLLREVSLSTCWELGCQLLSF